jgi:hypothetical protein
MQKPFREAYKSTLCIIAYRSFFMLFTVRSRTGKGLKNKGANLPNLEQPFILCIWVGFFKVFRSLSVFFENVSKCRKKRIFQLKKKNLKSFLKQFLKFKKSNSKKDFKVFKYLIYSFSFHCKG